MESILGITIITKQWTKNIDGIHTNGGEMKFKPWIWKMGQSRLLFLEYGLMELSELLILCEVSEPLPGDKFRLVLHRKFQFTFHLDFKQHNSMSANSFERKVMQFEWNLNITRQDPSVSKPNSLHVDIFRSCFIDLRYNLYILLKWSVSFLKSWTSIANFLTGSSASNRRCSTDIG